MLSPAALQRRDAGEDFEIVAKGKAVGRGEVTHETRLPAPPSRAIEMYGSVPYPVRSSAQYLLPHRLSTNSLRKYMVKGGLPGRLAF